MTGGWRPRLVVLDLDGTTVVDDTFEPSTRVRRAVGSVVAAGVPVTIATGRPVWSTLPIVRALQLADGSRNGFAASIAKNSREAGALNVVCSNGAVVFDPVAEKVAYRAHIDPAPAGRALAAARPDAGFATEYGIAGYHYTAAFRRDHTSVWLAELALDELLASATTRLVARLPQIAIDPGRGRCPQAAAWAAAAALDPAVYSCEIGHSGWLDIAAPGVSKASGVDLLAGGLGVDASDVLVIGDGGNDLALFSWAGWSVAMGQASAQVRAAADEVTDPVAADGVAVVLERYFP